MWTMVSEYPRNRTRYHIAGDDFIPYCGKQNMLVRDYVEMNNKKELQKIGESRQVHETMNEYVMCKICLKKAKAI